MIAKIPKGFQLFYNKKTIITDEQCDLVDRELLIYKNKPYIVCKIIISFKLILVREFIKNNDNKHLWQYIENIG